MPFAEVVDRAAEAERRISQAPTEMDKTSGEPVVHRGCEDTGATREGIDHDGALMEFPDPPALTTAVLR